MSYNVYLHYIVLCMHTIHFIHSFSGNTLGGLYLHSPGSYHSLTIASFFPVRPSVSLSLVAS